MLKENKTPKTKDREKQSNTGLTRVSAANSQVAVSSSIDPDAQFPSTFVAYAPTPGTPMSAGLFITILFNALKSTLGLLVFTLYIAEKMEWRLQTTLAILATTLPTLYSFNSWAEYNQLGERLAKKMKFEKMPTDESAELVMNTVYLSIDSVSDSSRKLLQYRILIPNENINYESEEAQEPEVLKIESLSDFQESDLGKSIMNKLEIDTLSGDIFKLSSEERKALEKIVIKEHKHPLRLELDKMPQPGTRIDHMYSFKILATVLPTSIINAVLLDISLTKGMNAGVAVLGGVILSTLNILNGIYDNYQTFGKHATYTTLNFLNNDGLNQRFYGKNLERGNIQGVSKHFPFNITSDPRMLGLLRELSPIIAATLNAGSFYNLASGLSDHWVWQVVSKGITFWLWANNISTSIHYNLKVIQRTLHAAEVEFNIESYFSRVQFENPDANLNSFIKGCCRVLGEILSWNHLLVESPAKYGVSSKRIAQMALFWMGVGSTALSVNLIKSYLLCFNDECYSNGGGLLLRSMFSGNTLDNFTQSTKEDNGFNPFALAFATILGLMTTAIYFTNLSRYPTFAESTRDHLSKDLSWKPSDTPGMFDKLCCMFIRAAYLKNPFVSRENIESDIRLSMATRPTIFSAAFSEHQLRSVRSGENKDVRADNDLGASLLARNNSLIS